MLALGNFMMRGFDLKTHLGQGQDNILPHIFGKIGWCEIKDPP